MKNQNTENLWDAIKKMGRFSDSYYDKSIERDMKRELGLHEEEDLQELPPEVIFSTFFRVMSPLAAMYEDILRLFVRCGANESSKTVEIEFQSSRASVTRFQIRHFMEARSRWEAVKICAKRISVNEKEIKKVCALWRGRVNETEVIKNGCFQNWAKEYRENRDRWPETGLDFKEAVRDLPAAELLTKCFECWQALYDFYRATDRKTVTEKTNHDSIGKRSDWESSLLRWETDGLLLSVLGGLYELAERYPSFSEKEKEKAQGKMTEFLKAFVIVDEYVEKNKQVWQEFLKLPVWEKRHEVYSIWVFTQIVEAFPAQCITYQIKDGTLTFPFSGAKLASVRLHKKVFAIWTELRTKAMVAPVGKGRKGAVQPDYSVVCGDENDGNDTVIVVECKQYKRASVKNFSQAMIDYAANRPNAKVLLVDYGEVDLKPIRRAMGQIPESRCDVFAKCRPQGEAAVRLRQAICGFLYRQAEDFEINPECPLCIELHWEGEEERQDFDLHMIFEDAHNRQRLFYGEQGIAGAEYSGDNQGSPGTERITVKKWNRGIYDVWVDNYTKTIRFLEGNPVVKVDAGCMAQTIEIKPEKQDSETADWWHVLRVDTRYNTGYLINRMESKPDADGLLEDGNG